MMARAGPPPALLPPSAGSGLASRRRVLPRAARTAVHELAVPSVLAALLVAGALAPIAAQATERYGERLSRMPVDYRTTATVTGTGRVRGELRGNKLTLRARFRGLSSPATAAHVHRAPKGRRGDIVFVVDVGTATETAGEFTATITLTDEQVAELRAERYYLQIHTAGNPGGELRGWLLRRGD